MEKKDILSLTYDELCTEIENSGEKKFRAKQIYKWLHRKKAKSFDEMTDLSENLRKELSDNFYIYDLKVVKKLVSSRDKTVKYLYGLNDGRVVEAVVMHYNHGNSLCISTQVGCKMGCKFCASTIAGFERNLTPSEMLSQVYFADSNNEGGISSIVLMGIGEPLDNFENVTKFIDILSDENGHNMSTRHISLSTCGVVPKIYDLAQKDYSLTLSISLHAPNDAMRSEIMPINNAYSIDKLIKACKDYFKTTGRRISFEYSLISGVNDSSECALELCRLLKGMNCHVNLIPVNEVAERSFRASKRESVEKFKDILTQRGITATVRRTLGADINAACGQLRRNYIKND